MTEPPQDDGILVCVRVSDMPRAGVASIAGQCERCGVEVWRSVASAPFHFELLCVPCALEEMAEHPGEIVPAPYVAADLRRRSLS